jgi:SRSO17 transposase
MNRREIARLDGDLRAYVDSMLEGMGRVERRAALGGYLTGLLLDGERKSIEPMAARLVDSPSEAEAMRQRLQQAVTIAEWSDDELYRRVALKLDRELPGVEALVVDDTGFPKKGEHSVGVKRQYSGTLGRVDNCQVAVSLHLAGEARSGCIGMRLFLPEDWARDRARREKAGVPDDVAFGHKWELSLAQIDRALSWGVRRHVVLGDCGYGDCTEFRDGLTERGLVYVVGVQGTHVVWSPESRPVKDVRQKKGAGQLRRRCLYRDEEHPPVSIAQLAAGLKYRKVTWREGSRGWQSSRFAAARIRSARRHANGEPPGDEQWLLCEWPESEPKPTKFWLSTLPKDTSTRAVVRLAKLRWRVERDYQEMKQEIGLDHFEGRSWRGFHHHAALCAAAHGFLALTRALFPPEEQEMDATDGPPPPPAGPTSAYRSLPAM